MRNQAEIRSYRDLEAWRQAVDLSVDIHRAVRLLPQVERFEIGRELRRSGISIPSNVAEGFNRHAQRAYRSHVGIALGSTGEVDTQLVICERLEYLPDEVIRRLLRQADHVGRLLQGLWHSLDRGEVNE